jgi:hypothetical protein
MGENFMRGFLMGAAVAALASTAAFATNEAQPTMAINDGVYRPDINPVGASDVQLFIYSGRHYCWYDDGWHGRGWYWCGYGWRRGYGWGGGYGWRHWDHRGWYNGHYNGWHDHDHGWDHGGHHDHHDFGGDHHDHHDDGGEHHGEHHDDGGGHHHH